MKLEYNPEISLGNIVQVVSILGTVFTAYLALRTTDIELMSRLDQHQVQIQDLKDQNKSIDAKIGLEIKDLSITIKNLDMRLTQFMLEQAQGVKHARPN